MAVIVKKKGVPSLIPSHLCQQWCEEAGGGWQEEIAMSGKVPAEAVFYGHCK